MEKAKHERKGLEFNIKELEKERDELIRDIKALKGKMGHGFQFKMTDRHISEKDKIYGDLIATRKKHETSESEAARIKVSYDRLLQEKEALETLQQSSQEEIKKYKDSV